MNTPRWSYEIPSVPGWYWWQPDPVADPRVVHLLRFETGRRYWLETGGEDWPVMVVEDECRPGRWLGPIEPPMAHEAWRPECRPSADVERYTYHDGTTIEVPVERCQWPGCTRSALCRSGNLADLLVCSEHFSVING